MNFSGYEWIATDSRGDKVGPGPNIFSSDNVWVDEYGLHLRIKDNTCAGATTKEILGEGRYVFKIIGRPDFFDPHTVLGLFLYDGSKIPYFEVDIEFCRWGESNGPVGSYTIYKDREDNPKTERFDVWLEGTHTTHSFEIDRYQASFQSFYGHEEKHLIHSKQFWNRESLDETGRLTPLFQSVASAGQINLWQFQGTPVGDTEVIIREFQFIPR